jgi:hypothetical protein
VIIEDDKSDSTDAETEAETTTRADIESSSGEKLECANEGSPKNARKVLIS